MEKLKTLLMAAPVALMAISCSQQDAPPLADAPADEGQTHEVMLSFSVNAGNIAKAPSRGSRATYDYSLACFIPKAGDAYYDENPGKDFAPPRELDSENSWQQVNDVMVYAYKEDADGAYRYTGQSYAITDFNNKFNPQLGGGPTAIWCGALPNNTFTRESYYYVTREEMATGNYKFLAIARDDKDADSRMLAIDGLAVGDDLNSVTASGSSAGNHHQTSEFFWKVAKDDNGNDLVYTVGQDTKALSINIGKINRAVAGLLFYVENIPATLTADDGKEYSVDYIGISTGAFADVASPAADLSATKSAVNDASFAHHCGRASLMEGFKVVDGYYVRPQAYSKAHPNALLLGSFIMPQSSKGVTNSLYLVYYHQDGSAVKPISWVPIKDENGNLSFDLQANHLYTLGTKRYSHDGSGFDKPEEDDVPVDLRVHDGKADLVIHVCPYYENSHTITIN